MIKNLFRNLYLKRDILRVDKAARNKSWERLSWCKSQMNDYSFKKAKEIVEYSFLNCEFYNNKYKNVGYENGDLKSWKDFEKLPILTKDDLREAINDKSIFSNQSNFKLIKTSTSGSTGVPLTLYFDHIGLKKRSENLWRVSKLFGIGYGKSVVQLWRKKKQTLSQLFQQKIGSSLTIPVLDVENAAYNSLSENDLDIIIEKILNFDAKIITGYVSALDSIATRILQKKIKINSLNHIITAAEALDETTWSKFERTYGCAVHNFYGGTEVPCLALNIDANHEMSTFDDYHRLEVVNEKTCLEERNEIGKILVTDYFMKAMPLIRYENGDLGQLSASNIANHPFRYLNKILGRINDKFYLPNGKIIYSHIWHIYFREINDIKRFKVIQTAPNNINIFLETNNIENLNSQIKELKMNVKKSLGQNININWKLVNQIGLDKTSKFRAVQSLIN